jgi:hypothetical protein
MLIAIASVNGEGATTLAVALAARWPHPESMVVEADPAGGDLALRFGYRHAPGLPELSAAVHSGGDVDLAAYTQRIPLGIDVVLGAPTSDTANAAAAVAALGDDRGLSTLRAAARGRLVVADVGRLDRRSPALPIACTADLLLLVSGADSDGLHAVQESRDALLPLPGRCAPVRLVLTGRLSAPADEIARTVGLPISGLIPGDRRGSAPLSGPGRARWGRTRDGLKRAASALALSLHTEFCDTERIDWRYLVHGPAAVPPVIGPVSGKPRWPT